MTVDKVRSSLKRRFLAGLIVLIPVIFTFSLIVWLFEFIDGILAPVLDRILGYHRSGLGFVSAIILVFLVGVVSTNVLGKRLIAFLEKFILKIPVFKGFYTALKQLVDAFSPDNKGSFKRFVIIQYPRPGAFSFGFLTKECTLKSERCADLPRLLSVYIPTNNLYLGEVVLFKEEDIFFTGIPIDEGIKIILSGGIACPSMIKEIGK
jgi:uncharacterized membrane protein